MLLSDRDLHAAITGSDLHLDPFDPAMVQPASIDLRLHNQFLVFVPHGNTHIDPGANQHLTEQVTVPGGEPFVLHPGQFVLGSTAEHVALSSAVAGRFEGKSSLGRLGLLVHSTAGFIDPGFDGRITAELANVTGLPILLWPGMPFAQLCVFRLTSPAERPYGTPGLGSRYQHQAGPTASRYHLNNNTKEIH